MHSTPEFQERDLPQAGWKPVHTRDRRAEQGDDYVPGRCEKCGREDLRFLHQLEHPETGEHLTVGCQCAANLCLAYDSKDEERRLKNLFQRKRKWLTRKWRRSRRRNEYLRIRVDGEQVTVTIFPSRFHENTWTYSLGWDDGLDFSGSYDTPDDAKLAAFDRLEELRASRKPQLMSR